MSELVYRECFDDGPGGWFGWISNHAGPKPLEWSKGQLTTRSPWWIDYNHAPPGAGYLHMLAVLITGDTAYRESYIDAGGANRFVDGGFSTDFRNARLTLRLKGELEMRGAGLLVLVQGTIERLSSGWLLTGSPFRVTPDWSEQTVNLTADKSRWTCLGSRQDRTRSYGVHPLERILENVNANIMLVLFPLDVAPMGPTAADPHRLRAGRDYPVWTSRLPEGYVVLEEVRIEFDNSARAMSRE
jgi:hypothetical protein